MKLVIALGSAMLAAAGLGCTNACDDLADEIDACGAPIARSDVGAQCDEAEAECVVRCLDQNDCGRGAGYAQCTKGCSVK